MKRLTVLLLPLVLASCKEKKEQEAAQTSTPPPPASTAPTTPPASEQVNSNDLQSQLLGIIQGDAQLRSTPDKLTLPGKATTLTRAMADALYPSATENGYFGDVSGTFGYLPKYLDLLEHSSNPAARSTGLTAADQVVKSIKITQQVGADKAEVTATTERVLKDWAEPEVYTIFGKGKPATLNLDYVCKKVSADWTCRRR